MDGLIKPPITSSQKPRTGISMLGGRGIGNSTGSCAERAAQAQAAPAAVQETYTYHLLDPQ